MNVAAILQPQSCIDPATLEVFRGHLTPVAEDTPVIVIKSYR